MNEDYNTESDLPEDPLASGRLVLRELVTHEPERHPLFIALVGPVGAPLPAVEAALIDSVKRFGYQTESVHLSDLLKESPYQPWPALPGRSSADYIERRMSAGDTLREKVESGSALAALAVAKVADLRKGNPLETAYFFNSLKHPDEVQLLRYIYGDAFTLVGVASSEESRRTNLIERLSSFGNPKTEAERLIERDESDKRNKLFGQNVRDTYALADVYIACERGFESVESVDRFTNALFGYPFLTPAPAEEAMKLAHDASLRSASAGRQVGAALVPVLGTPMILGTNEVPRPGGGQFWEGDHPDHRDFQAGYDSNPIYARKVIEELLDRLVENGWLNKDHAGLSGAELYDLAASTPGMLEDLRASSLIEFIRCMHAEQASIVNAARAGVATEGATLFSTHFPCHECAKVIIGAGIVDVRFIEPYPKSLAGRLYSDLVDTAPPVQNTGELVGGKVPFHSFVGIAPRMYERAFKQGNRKLENGRVVFDHVTAAPRTSSWSRNLVNDREAQTVSSITRILTALKDGELATGGAGALAEVDASPKPARRPRGPRKSTSGSVSGDEAGGTQAAASE